VASIPSQLFVRNLSNLKDHLPPSCWTDLVMRAGDMVVAELVPSGRLSFQVVMNQETVARVREILVENGCMEPEQPWQPEPVHGEWETDPEAWKNG